MLGVWKQWRSTGGHRRSDRGWWELLAVRYWAPVANTQGEKAPHSTAGNWRRELKTKRGCKGERRKKQKRTVWLQICQVSNAASNICITKIFVFTQKRWQQLECFYTRFMFLTAFFFYQFRSLLEGSGIKEWDFNLVKYQQITSIAFFLPCKYPKYDSFPEKTKALSGSVSLTPEAMNIRSCLSWHKDVNPEWQFYVQLQRKLQQLSPFVCLYGMTAVVKNYNKNLFSTFFLCSREFALLQAERTACPLWWAGGDTGAAAAQEGDL